MSEDDRIQRMREYVILADRLLDRIEDSDDRKYVAEFSHNLKEMIVKQTELQREFQELQMREEEFYKKFKTKEEAEEFDRGYSSRKVKKYAPYLDSAIAKAYGFAACIAACFSREDSKNLLRNKDSYKEASKLEIKLLQKQKRAKKDADEVIRKTSEREFAEARQIDELRKQFTISDDVAYEICKEPELVSYIIINRLKDRYAPDMEG